MNQPIDKDTTPPVPIAQLHPEVAAFLNDMRSDVREVKVALVGSQYTKGLIPRVDEHDTMLQQHDRKLLVWGSIISAAATAAVFLKDFFHTPK